MRSRSWWSPDEVCITHAPTGLRAIVKSWVRGQKGLWLATEFAVKIIRGKLAKRIEDPEWIDCGKSENRIRSYHMNPYLEIDPFVKNEKTGNRFPLTEQMIMNGNIDQWLKS